MRHNSTFAKDAEWAERSSPFFLLGRLLLINSSELVVKQAFMQVLEGDVAPPGAIRSFTDEQLATSR